MIVVGDIQNLALGCILQSNNKSLGVITFYINGVRFGNENYDYELDGFFECMKHNLNLNTDFPEGFAVPTAELFQSQRAIYSDDSKKEDCPLEKYFPGFWDEPSTIISKIFYIGVAYTFDDSSVVLFTNQNQMRLGIYDYTTGNCESVDLPKNRLMELVCELEENVFGSV